MNTRNDQGRDNSAIRLQGGSEKSGSKQDRNASTTGTNRTQGAQSDSRSYRDDSEFGRGENVSQGSAGIDEERSRRDDGSASGSSSTRTQPQR